MNYIIFRNSDGKVDAINRQIDGATVPYWDEENFLTQELREWEALNGQLDLTDKAAEPKQKNIDWKQFRTLFMGDIAYNRMANSVLGSPAQRIETWISAAAAIETQEWALFAGYWNNFIYYVPDAFKATAEEIVVWNQIATASEMPFSFIAGGAMELDAGLST